MKRNIILSTLLLSALFISCEEEKFITYGDDDVSGLYIQRRVSWTLGTNIENYADSSINYTFVGKPDSITFINAEVPVRLLGSVKLYDRYFTLNTIAEACINAKEGTDFEIIKEKCVIPAGKAMANVPIKVNRTARLKDALATIVVEIEENEHFIIPFLTYRSTNDPNVTNARLLSAVRYKMFVGEIYAKPKDWDTFMTNAIGLLGEWTPAKYNNLNVFMGWTIADWDRPGAAGFPIQSGRMPYCALMFQKHLQKMADSGTPVVDPDSEIGYVQLVDPYLVDYSKYGK